ncbi:hypothetical protein BPIT_28460 [Candidatus Brocadia pituitae]|nr:hypothetical protein BPIT_28460 [Candidatus Brocadia pituitae]
MSKAAHRKTGESITIPIRDTIKSKTLIFRHFPKKFFFSEVDFDDNQPVIFFNVKTMH